ncbi:MAG: hypothetical protein ACJ74Q_15975 [Pyrinomonadaceae bacterium]
MTNRHPARARAGRGEEGSAIIVAIILMAMLMTVSLAATSVRVAGARSADNHEAQQGEYWGARSGAAAVEASLRLDIPTAYDADVARAKLMAGGRTMPSFDSHDVAASSSRPLMLPDGHRSSYDAASCTSLLGNIDTWAAARWPVADEYARQLGYNAKVALLREAYRPALTGGKPFSEPGYALEFYVDAAAGQYGRVRPSGLILLGPANEGCNTTVTLDTSPATITQGETSTLVVTYTNASSVLVKDQGGAVVFSQAVANSGAAQTVNIPVSPSATTTYYATASNGTGCQADSAPRTLTVLIPPPQILSFDATPACIILGGTSTLSWSIKGATSATINGAPVNPTSGTMPVSPTATTSYTLVASNSSGTVQAQTTVEVTIPPKVNLFTAEPACVVFGSSSVLRWNVSDAASVTINGTPVDPSSGSMTVTPSSDTTYTLVATGAGCAPQTTQAQVTVSVTTPPQINQFTAAPASIIRDSGASSTLQWDVTGAVSATINGTPVNPAAGVMSVTPSATTVYTLVVMGGGCSPQRREAQVTVTVDEPAPLTCPLVNGFSATPSCIVAGQTSQLQWSVADADTVTINGSPVALSGALGVSPNVTTVYTLVASRTGCAPQQSQVTVEVSQPPTINSFAGSTNSLQDGQTATLQWDVSDASSVTIDGAAVSPTAGTLTVTPNTTHTYTIIATGGGCSPQVRQATFTINVTSCPSINLFDANPTTIYPGGSSTIRWDVNGAVGVTINGTPVAASGNMTVSPGGTTSYRLIAQSASGGCDIEQTITVTVSACPAPQVTSFTASPSSVTAGGNQMVRLSWSVSDPSGTGLTVSISPGVGSFAAASGFVDITQPSSTTDYTLTATAGCGGSSNAQATVTVNPAACSTVTDPLPASQVPSGPELLFIRGHNETTPCDPRNAVGCGDRSFNNMETAEFTWDTKGADNVTINGIPVPLKGDVGYLEPFVGWHDGTFSERPFGTKTYTFEAWNSSNPGVRDVHTVTVPFHPVEPDGHVVAFVTADSKNHAPGEPVTITYDAGKVEPPPTFAFNRAGVTVDVPGVATGLPATGSVTIAAPASTTDYTLVANQGGRSATVFFTIVVENPAAAGAGWGGSGMAYVPGPFIPFYHPVAVKARVLSNGAIHLRHYIFGADFSIPITGYVGGGGLYPTGGGYSAGGIAEVYKDGVPLVERLTFGDPPGINNFYMPFPGTALMAGYAPIPGLPVKDEIIPAALIPNAGCGRIDVKYLGFGSVNWMGFSNTNSPPAELFDTRTGFQQASPFGGAPSGRYYVVPSWTQNDWDNGDAYR